MPSYLNTFEGNLQFTTEPVICGIDEAGRGPVIGPMVYSIYVSRPNAKTTYKDSKLLSANMRENFFERMKNNLNANNEEGIIGYAYYKIHPVFITTNMHSNTKTLNEIAKEAVIKLLHYVKSKCTNVEAVYVDGLGNNNDYKKELEKHFNYKFTVENKADSTYQVVSGASIVAKVIRDQEVSIYNCGSGYPSDPDTIKWLKNNISLFKGSTNNVRHSWMTVKRMLGIKKARKLKGSLSCFYVAPN